MEPARFVNGLAGSFIHTSFTGEIEMAADLDDAVDRMGDVSPKCCCGCRCGREADGDSGYCWSCRNGNCDDE